MPEGTTAVTLMRDLLSVMLYSEVVLAAIMASSITIGGVYLANRHARKLQREALDQDAMQREKDRKLSLRRDVYLPAADSILRAQNLLMRLLDPATPLQEVVSQLPNEVFIISRTLVVGSDKTIQSVLMILDAIGDTFETLVFKRAALINFDEHIDSIEFGINECGKLYQLIPPALVAIREELELSFDQEAFSKIYINNAKKRADRLQAKLNEIRRD